MTNWNLFFILGINVVLDVPFFSLALQLSLKLLFNVIESSLRFYFQYLGDVF